MPHSAIGGVSYSLRWLAIQKQTAQVTSVTSLRFFAALGVLFHHLGERDWMPSAIRAYVNNGFVGVTFFFVLSGFVLTLRYLDSSFSLKSFLHARLLRIMPLYIVALLFSAQLERGNYDGELFMRHLVGIQAWESDIGRALSLNSPAWTISVEMFLYACFPVIILLAKFARTRRGGPSLFLATAVIGCFSYSLYWMFIRGAAYEGFDASTEMAWPRFVPIWNLGPFVLGCAAGVFVQSVRLSGRLNEKIGSRTSAAGLVSLVATIFIVNLDGDRESPVGALLYAGSREWIIAIPAAALFVGLTVSPSSRMSKLLSGKPLVQLGLASYALYIFHAPITDFMSQEGVTSIGPVIAVVIGSSLIFEMVTRSIIEWTEKFVSIRRL